MLIGDEAFILSHKVAITLLNYYIHKIRILNYRRFVECAFGSLWNKVTVSNKPFNVKVSSAVDIIKYCCVLYNIFFVVDRIKLDTTGRSPNYKCIII